MDNGRAQLRVVRCWEHSDSFRLHKHECWHFILHMAGCTRCFGLLSVYASQFAIDREDIRLIGEIG